MIVLSLPLQSIMQGNYSQVDEVKVQIPNTQDYIQLYCIQMQCGCVTVYTHTQPQYIAIYIASKLIIIFNPRIVKYWSAVNKICPNFYCTHVLFGLWLFCTLILFFPLKYFWKTICIIFHCHSSVL